MYTSGLQAGRGSGFASHSFSAGLRVSLERDHVTSGHCYTLTSFLHNECPKESRVDPPTWALGVSQK